MELELAKANVPFQKFGGMKFVETAHVKDVMAFLRIAVNPKDVISWYRVLLIHEGIGPKTAQKILDELATARITIKAEPDQQPEFKYRILGPVVLSFVSASEKETLPSEMVQMVFDYYHPFLQS